MGMPDDIPVAIPLASVPISAIFTDGISHWFIDHNATLQEIWVFILRFEMV